jgi:hypothetical protein
MNAPKKKPQTKHHEGRALREARTANELTVPELAALLGIGKTAVVAAEKAETFKGPRSHLMRALTVGLFRVGTCCKDRQGWWRARGIDFAAWGRVHVDHASAPRILADLLSASPTPAVDDAREAHLSRLRVVATAWRAVREAGAEGPAELLKGFTVADLLDAGVDPDTRAGMIAAAPAVFRRFTWSHAYGVPDRLRGETVDTDGHELHAVKHWGGWELYAVPAGSERGYEHRIKVETRHPKSLRSLEASDLVALGALVVAT